MSEPPVTTPRAMAGDDDYRRGAVDLLGILGYGALAAFERLADDAGLAPTLADKVHVVSMAGLQVGHFERVRARLVELDADRPFRVFADGDPVGTLPATVTVRPGAVRVLLPS